MYSIVDFKSRQVVEPRNFIFTGKEGPWEVMMDLEAVNSKINREYFSKAPPYASKYLPFMPISNHSEFQSLGAGATPLIKSNSIGPELGIELYFKLESQNPTGSFKDRGSAVEISVARELGAKGIVVASTGNMAASCSCYAANAHIPCFVFVPEDTPQSKLAQVIAYGGKVVQVKGGYGEAAALAQEVAERLGFYLAEDYAFRIEGHKTAAFELIDQLFFRPPHYVVVPMGCGTNLASYYKGFSEYKQMDFIHRIPTLIGVQAEGAPTIVSSFEKGLKEPTRFSEVKSVAKAICINHALDGSKALDAIYQTGGQAIALGDQEMLEYQYKLSRQEGIFVEPSCAATIASLTKLAKTHDLSGKRMICVLPGTGLKDPTAILRIAIKPPSIEPNVSDFMNLFERDYFKGQSVSFLPKNKVLFASLPSKEDVKKASSEFLPVSYSDEHLGKICVLVEKFLQKGKPVTFADFQDIIQEVLESRGEKSQSVLSIEEFEVTASSNKKAKAKVEVSIAENCRTAVAEGTGPVDAVLNAISEACGEDFSFTLEEYRPVVRSEGPDAVVFCELKLERNGKTALGSGTSPDIIQASVEAFEDAYNSLYVPGR